MSAWWAGVPGAETTVECGGSTHRVRWADGRLEAVDHDDAEGERALAALGGEPCRCVELLDAWARHADDLRVLVIASRGPGDVVATGAGTAGLHGTAHGIPATVPARPSRPPMTRSGQVGWIAASLGGASGRIAVSVGGPAGGGRFGQAGPDAELLGLLGLDGGLPERLQASVIGAWAERLAGDDGRCRAAAPRLAAAVHGRAAAGLRAWLGRPDLVVDVALADAGQPPRLEWVAGRRVAASLPFAWLEAVWARGLTTVMGRFCLTATSPDGCAWELTTVGPELGRPETIGLELPRPGRAGGR